MANLSKATFFDAGSNPPRVGKSFILDGERRIEHIPNGKVERWVKGSGSIVFQQLLQPGQLIKEESVDAKRGEISRLKPHDASTYDSKYDYCPIEWHKCPILTGRIPASYFPLELRESCPEDFKPRHAADPCRHVAHVIATRRAEHQRRQNLLHAAQVAAEEAKKAEAAALRTLEERKLEALERQATATTELIKQLAGERLGAPAAAAPSSAPSPAARPRRGDGKTDE